METDELEMGSDDGNSSVSLSHMWAADVRLSIQPSSPIAVKWTLLVAFWTLKLNDWKTLSKVWDTYVKRVLYSLQSVKK